MFDSYFALYLLLFITEQDINIMSGNYCTCQSGSRTFCTCAHVASILWYLGYARHQPHIKYPDRSLHTTMDVVHRVDQEDLNNKVEVIDY